MTRSLNQREKNLLILVLATLFIVLNFIIIREFNTRLKVAKSGLTQLQDEINSNEVWMRDQAFWQKRKAWLDDKMPYTESAGRAQGQLLEMLQNSALDLNLNVTNTTLLEPVELDYAREVAVSIRVRGDQDVLIRWLLGLQQPERFQAIKNMDLELDAQSREKTPQAQCNITVARWFNTVNLRPTPLTPPNLTGAPIQTSPTSTLEADEEQPVDPLELDSPL